ncbi:hypothetical protein GCM10025771_36240 [Niveibacterium umoris]
MLPGNRLLVRSRKFFIAALLFAIPSAALGLRLAGIWGSVSSLSGAEFLISATAFGLALIVLPLGALVCLAVALFMRVESAVVKRSPQAVGVVDRLCVAGAVLLSLLPAAWPASKAFRALVTGAITIRLPMEHTFSMASDPLAFTENIAYWLFAAAALAGLAVVYWRGRWQRFRSLPPADPPVSR